MKKDKIRLLLIVLVAFLVRVLVIWIDRPEFTGWFNHTYYYFVEVRGLLENGTLPFPDMPLLFYIYAFTSKILIWFGINSNDAIVISARFWMSLIPSLIPIPIFLILKNISKQEDEKENTGGYKLENWMWVLIFVSAFLPLSILHIPEFSQKTALGILLLSFFIYLSKKSLTSFKIKDVVLPAIVFILIILTHFGTAGVFSLYILSILTAKLIANKETKSAILYIAIISIILILTAGIIYLIDLNRFERIFYYLQNSLDSSFIGVLFSTDSNFDQRLEAIFAVAIPILIVLLFYKLFLKSKTRISEENKLFWLTNIIFFYLLILPVYDQLLYARFVIFLSLPVLIILTFVIKYSISRIWIKKTVLTLILIGTALMAFGEIMSLKIHNTDKNEIYSDLMTMKEKQKFQSNDLIITKNGAEHICNWFLGTKSGVITSLNLSDFEKYQNVYILNPIEGELNFQGIENRSAANETDKYLFMMRNILKPKNSETVYDSEFIQLLKIDEAPEEWEFDNEGNWMSYGN